MRPVDFFRETRQYVAAQYGFQRSIGNDTALKHAERVAGYAAKMILAYHANPAGTGYEVDERKYIPVDLCDRIAYVQHAAWLHEAVERTGSGFEEIRDLTCIDVARLVASMTHDPRLPLEHRQIEYRARIHDGGDETAVLVLADSASIVQALHEWGAASGEAVVDEVACATLDVIWKDLEAIPSLNYHPVLKSFVDRLARGMNQMRTAIEQRIERRRAARAISQTITRRKESASAERPVATAVKRVRKNKGNVR